MTSDDETVKEQVPQDQRLLQDRDAANNGEDTANPASGPPTTLPDRVITPPPSGSGQDTSRTAPDPLVLERRRLTAERLRIQAEVLDLERKTRELSAREESMRTIDQTGSTTRSMNEADEWVYALYSLQVSEMLVTLNANPLGSSGILRDRLLRALKRNIDPETVWTLEDQPITRFSDEITDKGVQNSFISPPRCGAAATTTMTTTTTITTMATGLLTVNTTPTSTGSYLPMESRPLMSTGVPLGRRRPIPSPRTMQSPTHVRFPPAANSTMSQANHLTHQPGCSPITRDNHDTDSRNGLSRTGSAHYQPAMYERVSKWNFKFSGQDSSKLEPFLRRLEECQVTCGFNDADVLAVMPLILTGAAKTWWTHMKGAIDSYDVLCNALRERFGEPDIE
ncbi:hypothetical protein KQX54_012030, partial [Cotesia glomerata]